MARSRSGSSGRSSSRPTPSYFGSAPSRSSHSSASPSPAATRTATPVQHQPHAPPPAVAAAHPPAQHPSGAQHQPAGYQRQQQQQPAPSGGGGLLSGIAGTVMQGMAFGGGSAIAHRAVDSIAGPRTVVHEHQGAAAEATQQQQAAAASTTMAAIDTGDRALNRRVQSQCGDEVLQFQRCLTDSGNDLSSCSFYFDVLTQCQNAVKENAKWSS